MPLSACTVKGRVGHARGVSFSIFNKQPQDKCSLFWVSAVSIYLRLEVEVDALVGGHVPLQREQHCARVPQVPAQDLGVLVQPHGTVRRQDTPRGLETTQWAENWKDGTRRGSTLNKYINTAVSFLLAFLRWTQRCKLHARYTILPFLSNVVHKSV